MIYHLVVGDEAAKPLLAAISAEEGLLTGEVVVLRDLLHIGPLQREEGQSFSALRSNYWSEVAPFEKAPVVIDDLERLLQVSTELHKDPDTQAWFWMAPAASDAMAYYWALPYLGRHTGRCYILNITALPFLDASGKLFYPKNISALEPREVIKARRLARPVTPAEVEVDGDEWQKLVGENSGVRTLEGGRKIASRDADFYDETLVSFAGTAYAKASKVIFSVLKEKDIPTGDTHLAWRLRELAAQGRLQLRGEPSRSLRDWEVRLAEEEAAEQIDREPLAENKPV